MWGRDEHAEEIRPYRPTPPVEIPEHGKPIVEFVKRELKHSLYEDSDFEITDEYISIDLVYDSRSYVSYHQERIQGRFPGRTRTDGTRVTVHFGETT